MMRRLVLQALQQERSGSWQGSGPGQNADLGTTHNTPSAVVTKLGGPGLYAEKSQSGMGERTSQVKAEP